MAQAAPVAVQTATPRQKRASVKRFTQFSTAMSYAAVLVLIASIVSVGYQSPVDQQVASRGVSTAAIQAANPSVDQIVAAELAATTADVADLAIASNVSNLSISLNAKSDLSQTDNNVLSKPQIVQTGGEHRGIIEYRVASGDNVNTVASRFGISAQTVRWANNLATDALSPGTKLAIPGTDGVVYTVGAGDTLDSIARKYGVNKQRVVAYNDLEISGVKPGQRLVLPDGIVPVSERPSLAQVPARGFASSSPSFTANAASVGNRYDYGYCTFYAYNRRAELGRPIGSFWGNAVSWAGYARSSGYNVSNTPAVGAVLQNGGGYGHVAVVESVGGDGSVTVSEMNYVGWNVISTRTISPGQAGSYNYIH